jgi:hypothetical protein
MRYDVRNWLNNATIGQKIILICLILVIVPTVTIGYVAYTSAEATIKHDIRMSLEMQTADITEETKTVYDLTQVKVNSDLNILRQLFYDKGKPSNRQWRACSWIIVPVNNNFEIRR